MLVYFVQGLLLALPTTLTPGSFKVFLISESLQNGFRRSWPIAFAPAITDGPIIVLVVLALTQLPQTYLDLLRLLGGFFLLYLAARIVVLLRRTTGATLQAPGEHAGRQSLGRAIVINLLNPNPYIFWAVVAGPILVGALEQSLVYGLTFVIAFYGAFITGLLIVAWVFGTIGQINATLNRVLLGVAAAGMVGIGLFQIWNGGRALLGV